MKQHSFIPLPLVQHLSAGTQFTVRYSHPETTPEYTLTPVTMKPGNPVNETAAAHRLRHLPFGSKSEILRIAPAANIHHKAGLKPGLPVACETYLSGMVFEYYC